jgi:hypothetical protein
MTKSNTHELTIDELDLASGGRLVSAGWVGGFWFALDSGGTTTVGAGNTFVATNGSSVAVIKT